MELIRKEGEIKVWAPVWTHRVTLVPSTHKDGRSDPPCEPEESRCVSDRCSRLLRSQRRYSTQTVPMRVCVPECVSVCVPSTRCPAFNWKIWRQSGGLSRKTGNASSHSNHAPLHWSRPIGVRTYAYRFLSLMMMLLLMMMVCGVGVDWFTGCLPPENTRTRKQGHIHAPTHTHTNTRCL